MKWVETYRLKSATIVFLVGIVLTGCAAPTSRVTLSESDQQQIKEGKLLKFSDKMVNPTIDPMKASMMGDVILQKSTDAIYVCAVPALFTEKCFPHVSSRIAKYFTDRGVRVTNDPAAASKKLYVAVAYNYWGAVNNPTQLPTLEESLAKNDALDIGAENTEADQKRQDEQIKQEKTNFLVSLAMVALAAKAGGGSSMQQANGVDSVSSNNHISGSVSNKKKVLWIILQSHDGGVHMLFPTRETAFVYTGPVDLQNSFAPLFDDAMKEVANDVVKN